MQTLRGGQGTSLPIRARRIWRFADAEFDEGRWTLRVAGAPVALEQKPMLLLHVLLDRSGEAVSKDDLLDAVWPGVVVVEGSLPTAVAKLRRALLDEAREAPVVITVPRYGYRIGVPLTLVQPSERVSLEEQPIFGLPLSESSTSRYSARRWVPIGAIVLLLIAAAVIVGFNGLATSRVEPVTPSQVALHRDGVDAVRRLDIQAVERLIGQGWNPAQPVDTQDNDALKMLLERCEWQPTHDQSRMLVMARTLVDGGAILEHRNVWGDTAYSIAAAPRYCSVHHPVTVMLRSLCYDGTDPPGVLCEADYSQRRPLLPPSAVIDRRRPSER